MRTSDEASDQITIDVEEATNDSMISAIVLRRERPEVTTLAIASRPSLYARLRAANCHAVALWVPPFDRGPVDPAQVADFIVGGSLEMRSILNLVERVAVTDISVLIEGESGSGKELLAQIIRQESSVANGPFMTVNCAAIPPHLLEGELFGYVRGAFTDAKVDHPGLFEVCDGGTLFLDEVGELGIDFQAKLLRVLESGEVRRIGSSSGRRVSVRVISATNRNLEQEVRGGRFRKDLYYRLNQFFFRMPTLAERKSDIPLLVFHFLEKFAAINPEVREVEPEVLAVLSEYEFPGNLRELRNLIQRLKVIADPPAIRLMNLPAHVRQGELRTVDTDLALTQSASVSATLGLDEAMAVCERNLLSQYLETSGGRAEDAAHLAHVPLPTFYRKLRAHGLTPRAARERRRSSVR